MSDGSKRQLACLPGNPKGNCSGVVPTYKGGCNVPSKSQKGCPQRKTPPFSWQPLWKIPNLQKSTRPFQIKSLRPRMPLGRGQPAFCRPNNCLRLSRLVSVPGSLSEKRCVLEMSDTSVLNVLKPRSQGQPSTKTSSAQRSQPLLRCCPLSNEVLYWTLAPQTTMSLDNIGQLEGLHQVMSFTPG